MIMPSFYLRHYVQLHERYEIVEVSDDILNPTPADLLNEPTVKTFGEQDRTIDDPARKLTKVELLLAGLTVPEGMI
jgi:hypothetical protein